MADDGMKEYERQQKKKVKEISIRAVQRNGYFALVANLAIQPSNWDKNATEICQKAMDVSKMAMVMCMSEYPEDGPDNVDDMPNPAPPYIPGYGG